jgi:Mg-chelatase subunit ChlI
MIRLGSVIINAKSVVMPSIYPFTAIVGQERMKRALVLNAVSPRIGGVLIRGERGTANDLQLGVPNAGNV